MHYIKSHDCQSKTETVVIEKNWLYNKYEILIIEILHNMGD